ncbi:MAG TPA: hypothetical protein PLI45_03655 [Candidatus Woesebacteria bacterium]|nr:hypothetical protein [Candidatus Woesebacteria bacterium]
MKYEVKLGLILKALVEAKKASRNEHSTKLYIKEDNFLEKIGKEEVQDILSKLEYENKILTINPIYNRLLSPSSQPKNLDYLLVDINPKFDDWYAQYLIQQKSTIENLSETNFKNISHIMHLIEEQLELVQSEKLAIDFISSAREIEGYEPEDVDDIINTYIRSLTYLKNIGVVKNFTTAYMTLSSGLTLNIARFFEVLEQVNNFGQKNININKEEQEDKTSNKSPDETVVVYEITYTKQRQILMNNAQIGRPDFNSENDLVFSFLYENPNRRIGIDEIEKTVGGKLTKSLHKIVENLGFEGDTKEVFFSVSKNAIEFRNPITKKDLEEMKKPLIKLVKGGGKLVLPH